MKDAHSIEEYVKTLDTDVVEQAEATADLASAISDIQSTLYINSADIKNLHADFADIDYLVAKKADIGKLNADWITAGTLTADRVLLKSDDEEEGEKSLYYMLNAEALKKINPDIDLDTLTDADVAKMNDQLVEDVLYSKNVTIGGEEFRSLNQYVWLKENGTNQGIYITKVPQEQFVQNPSGGNTLIDSDGIAIRDGETSLASFKSSGAIIGETDKAHTEIDGDSTEWYLDDTHLVGGIRYGESEATYIYEESQIFNDANYGYMSTDKSFMVGKDIYIYATGMLSQNTDNPDYVGLYTFDKASKDDSEHGEGKPAIFNFDELAYHSRTNNYYNVYETQARIRTSLGTLYIPFYITFEGSDSQTGTRIHLGFRKCEPGKATTADVSHLFSVNLSLSIYKYGFFGEKVFFGSPSSEDEIVSKATNLFNDLRIGENATIEDPGTYAIQIGNSNEEGKRANSFSIDYSGNTKAAGNIYTNNHSTPIGYNSTGSGTKNNFTNNSQSELVGGLSVSPGTWLLVCRVGFPSNTTGRRFACWHNDTTDNDYYTSYSSSPPANGGYTNIQTTMAIKLDANTTLSVHAFQNSGSAMNVAYNWSIVRIA